MSSFRAKHKEARRLVPGDILVGMLDSVWLVPWLVISAVEQDVTSSNIGRQRVMNVCLLRSKGGISFYEWPIWPDSIVRVV